MKSGTFPTIGGTAPRAYVERFADECAVHVSAMVWLGPVVKACRPGA